MVRRGNDVAEEHGSFECCLDTDLGKIRLIIFVMVNMKQGQGDGRKVAVSHGTGGKAGQCCP
jgi:hypothetical protein